MDTYIAIIDCFVDADLEKELTSYGIELVSTESDNDIPTSLVTIKGGIRNLEKWFCNEYIPGGDLDWEEIKEELVLSEES